MCTYATEQTAVVGSAKRDSGWMSLTRAMVYYDHPQHAPAAHTVNIDFLNEAAGPSGRVAVELTAASARRLIEAINHILESAGDLVEMDDH